MQRLLWHDKLLTEAVTRRRRLQQSTDRVVVDTDVILKYLICQYKIELDLSSEKIYHLHCSKKRNLDLLKQQSNV